MTRRDLFKALAAAPVVAAAAEAVPTPAELMHPKNLARALQKNGLDAPLGLHPKQLEAWRALHDPNVRAVLFSGARAIGKTHLAHVWADYLYHRGEDCLALFPDQGSKRRWAARRIATRPITTLSADQDLHGLPRHGFMILDDAHRIGAQAMSRGVSCFWQGVGWHIPRKLVPDDCKLLLTALPGGDGGPWLRALFPRVGWNGPNLYHVNAAMTDNPYLIGKWR
jgi:hypothetical protein